jgi:prepilin-type N-terminal cleavage/methylation domain-containing protein
MSLSASRSSVKKEAIVTTDPRRPQGFSLIELLVVMAIIAITSAIAIPLGIDYVRNYEVMGAAQGVAAQMQMSRAQAVRRNSRRGILLNFDYPQAGQSQFTTLDANPMTGAWDNPVYPDNPGVFDPGVRDYGTVPDPPFNVDSPGDNLPSPHGEVITLPTQMEFVDVAGGYTSLLFRMDGSVEAVNAVGVAVKHVEADGLNWVVEIRNLDNGLRRIITISRNGRVVVDVPPPAP